MSLLRFIDVDGKEQDVADINHLYELIQAGHIGYDSLVRDDNAGRWVLAHDHELFGQIRNIASQTAATLSPSSAGLVTKKTKWLARIETSEDALVTIKRVSVILFVLAGGFIGLGTIPMLIVSLPRPPATNAVALVLPLLFLGLGLWLRYGKSRIAAVVLLIFLGSWSAVMIIEATVMPRELMLKLTVPFSCLVAIFLYTAAKAIEATFKLHRRFKIESAHS